MAKLVGGHKRCLPSGPRREGVGGALAAGRCEAAAHGAQHGLLRGLILALLTGRCGGLYDPYNHIESARLYGNINEYAYYFVDLLVGTPPQRVSVILDTGSGICAFPCASCGHCGSHIDPAFDYARSSTAHWVNCGGECTYGSCANGHCQYYQGYTEGSSIRGFWFEDYVRIGDAIQRNPAVRGRLGCHQNENNLFYTQRANGILGIGPGDQRHTLLRTLFGDREHVQTAIFSICLAEWGGRLVVGGHNATYHTGPIQWVQLQQSGFYHVSLTGVSLDGRWVSQSNFGQTMIDSGTTYCYMGTAPYRALRNAIESYCQQNNGCGSSRHSGKCWDVADVSRFPVFIVHFGSIRTEWRANSYLYNRGNSWCLAFEDDGHNANTVLGAAWMRHKEVIFDTLQSRVGIADARCPEFYQRPSHDPNAPMELPQTTVDATTTLPAPTTTPPPPTTTPPPTLPPTTTPPPTTTTLATTTTPPPVTTTTPLPTTTLAATTTPTKASTSIATTVLATAAPPTTTPVTGNVSHTQQLSPRPTAVSTTAVPGNQTAVWDQLGLPANRPVVILSGSAVLLTFGCCCLLLYRCCCRQREHRHVQLKDEDSGMPPQIVGSADGGVLDPDTFVIGDDDVDVEDEEFEYVHDVHDMEMSPPPPSPRGSGHASPRGSPGAAAKASPHASPVGGHGSDSGLRNAGFGSPRWEDPPPVPATGLIPTHSESPTLFDGPVFSGPTGPVE